MSITMKHLVAGLALGIAALGASTPALAGGSIGVSITAPIGNGGFVTFGATDGHRHGGYGYGYRGYAAPAYVAPAYVAPAYVAPAMPAPLYEQVPVLSPGYVWNSGKWEWTGYDWRWTPGYASYVGTVYRSAPVYVAPASTVFIGSGYYGHRHHYRDGYRHWR